MEGGRGVGQRIDQFSSTVAVRFLVHHVYVDLQISDELSSVVVAQLLFLQSESNKKPIHMYINSPGLAVQLLQIYCLLWRRIENNKTA